MAVPCIGNYTSAFVGQKLELCAWKLGDVDEPRWERKYSISAVAVQASDQFSQRLEQRSRRSRIEETIGLDGNDDFDALAHLFDDESKKGDHWSNLMSESTKQGSGTRKLTATKLTSAGTIGTRTVQKKVVRRRIRSRPPLSKEGQEGRLLEQLEAKKAKAAAGRRPAMFDQGGIEGRQVAPLEHMQEEPAAVPLPGKGLGKLSRREWEELAMQRLRQQRLRKMEVSNDTAVEDESSLRGAEHVGEGHLSGRGGPGKGRGKGREAVLVARPKVSPGRVSFGAAELSDPIIEPGAGVEERSDLSQASTPDEPEGAAFKFLESHKVLFDDLNLNAKERAVGRYLLSLGFAMDDFKRLADKRLQAFLTNVHAARARVEYLRSLGVQARAIPKLLVRHPQLLEYSIERTMKPRVEYLSSLGVERAQLGRIITLAPTLLQHSVEGGLKPRVRFLQEVVGITDRDIPLVVQRSPQVLTQSIENSLQPKLQFLQSLGVDFEGLARMVTRHPQLLHYSVQECMQPRVDFLRSIGMSGPDIVRTVVRLSQILSLSVESNLVPKYEYLTNHLGGNANTIIRFPAYFSLSLEQRIKPRHQFLQEMKKLPKGSFPMKYLAYTDQEFCRVVHCSVQDYENYKDNLLLRSLAKKFGNVTLGAKKNKKTS